MKFDWVKNKARKILCVLALLGSAPLQAANDIPDFYHEPGINPNRQYSVDLQGVETIDPFTGILRLSYKDLVIPGNGGLDIVINRTYHLAQQISGVVGVTPYKNGRTTTGMGWDIHFGRILYDGALFPNGCQVSSIYTDGNPVLELPDGTRKVLFNKLSGSSSDEYITKDRWTATCIDIPNGSYRDGGLLVTSPDGVKYTMNMLENYRGQAYIGDNNDAWHTTRIEDKNGNWISIQYVDKGTTQYAIIDRITSSDGRVVDFTYQNPTANEALLTRISANGQVWNYDYQALPNDALGYYFLDRVRGPEGLIWSYDYHTSGDGLYSLRRITTPYGGVVDYTYQERVANQGVVGGLRTTAIDTKNTSGPGITDGTWDYSFGVSSNLDVTTIITPNGREVYRHCGERAAFTGSPATCQIDIGKLMSKEIYDGSTLIQTEQYQWGESQISQQNEKYPTRGYYVPNVYATRLEQKVINRNGTIFTTEYSDFDVYDNPRRIEETSEGETRRTDYTYYINTSRWIVKQVEDEILYDNNGQKIITRDFYTNGNLRSINRYGNTIQYSYTTQGDISSITDPRSKTTSYSNYKRGVPQTENHPESVTIRRTVNNDGTIANETNGRNYQTSYSYDHLNRVTSINPPRGSTTSVSYNWSSRYRNLTRGTFSQRLNYDGFGKVLSSTAEGITIDYEYNSVGQKIFQSYPNSTQGTDFDNDILNRPIRITHTSDNSYVRYDYWSRNRVRVTDENNKITTYRFQSYGDPDERYLINIYAPESVTTDITRTKRGDIQSISQGGKTRNYVYDSHYYLDYIDHPELGRVDVLYDASGNKISSRTGSSATTSYVYDDLNRLERINYPGSTPDVTFGYDDNNNLDWVLRGVTRWDYGYDQNDNLTSESLAINGRNFDISYAYNALDALSSITYPSTLNINYAPNDLGWPTQAGVYADNVTYYDNGQINSFSYGNGRSQTIGQDNRLFVQSIQSTGIADLVYSYDDVGNILNIQDRIDSSYNRTMTYDDLNRLETVSGSWGSGSIGYNTKSDITSKRIGADNLNYQYQSSTGRLSSTSGYKSYSFDYDDYGNVINNGFDAFVYDDASNLTEITNQNIQNVYDGHNRRIAETVNGQTKYYVYNKAGQLVFETTQNEVKQVDYVRLGSLLIAKRDVCSDGDMDGDTLPDCFEVNFGLNPEDPSDAVGDMDDDGLTNLQEFQLGTLLNNSDTDNDEMTDGFEVQYGLDVLNDDAELDLDSDSYSNLEEFQRGSDPSDPLSIPPGEIRWSITNNGIAGMAVASDGVIYLSLGETNRSISGGDGTGEVFDEGQVASVRPDGTIAWTLDLIGTLAYSVSQPVLDQANNIYLVLVDHDNDISGLYSISPAGTVNWNIELDVSGGSNEIGQMLPNQPSLNSDSPNKVAIGSNGIIYVATGNRIHAFNSNGEQVWSERLPQAITDSLATDADGNLYVMTQSNGRCQDDDCSQLIDNINIAELMNSNLFAIDSMGNLLWHQYLPGGSNFAPAIGIDGTLYYGSYVRNQGSRLYAVSRTGDLLWTNTDVAGCEECANGVPAVVSKDGTIYASGLAFVVINPDGTTRWLGEYLWYSNSLAQSPILGRDGNMYVGTDGGFYSVDENGLVNWYVDAGQIGQIAPSPLPGGDIYAATQSGFVAFASNSGGLADAPWPMEGQNIQKTASAPVCSSADTDADADGIPDCIERMIGLNPNDSNDASADIDGDGLSNLEEYNNRTHYFLSDSDGDGLDDNVELLAFHHPLDPDMDNDGMPDGYEVDFGFDPLFTDSSLDNDGDGFSNMNEFIAGTDPTDPTNVPDNRDLIQLFHVGNMGIGASDELMIGHEGTIFTNNGFGISAYASDGSFKWLYPGEGYQYAASIVGQDDVIYTSAYSYIYGDPRYLKALSADGQLLWSLEMNAGSKALGANGVLYVYDADQQAITAVRPDGSIYWRYSSVTNPNIYNIKVGPEGRIFVSSSMGLIALNYHGELLWQRDDIVSTPSAISQDGILYFATMDSVYGINASDGIESWRYTSESYSNYSEVLVDINNVVSVWANEVGDFNRKSLLEFGTEPGNLFPGDYTAASSASGRTLTDGDSIVWLNKRDYVVYGYDIFNRTSLITERINLYERLISGLPSHPVIDGQKMYVTYNGKVFVYNLPGMTLPTAGWPTGGHDPRNTNSLAGNLTAINEHPVIALASPMDGGVYIEGGDVDFSATAVDYEDGDVSSSIVWVSNRDGNIGSGADLTAILSLGEHQITVSATDSLSGTKVKTFNLTINPVWDTDGDGMADQWEISEFGTLDQDGTGDFDGDGVTDLQEYLNSIMPANDGDINGDAVINISDVILMQQHILGTTLLTSEQIAHGDLYPETGDGEITLSDLLLLQQRVLGTSN